MKYDEIGERQEVLTQDDFEHHQCQPQSRMANDACGNRKAEEAALVRQGNQRIRRSVQDRVLICDGKPVQAGMHVTPHAFNGVNSFRPTQDFPQAYNPNISSQNARPCLRLRKGVYRRFQATKMILFSLYGLEPLMSVPAPAILLLLFKCTCA